MAGVTPTPTSRPTPSPAPAKPAGSHSYASLQLTWTLGFLAKHVSFPRVWPGDEKRGGRPSCPTLGLNLFCLLHAGPPLSPSTPLYPAAPGRSRHHHSAGFSPAAHLLPWLQSCPSLPHPPDAGHKPTPFHTCFPRLNLLVITSQLWAPLNKLLNPPCAFGYYTGVGNNMCAPWTVL